MQDKQGRFKQFLEIVEQGHDGVVYWDIAPAIPFSDDCEEMLRLLQQRSQMSYCNSRAVELLGYPDTVTLMAASAEELNEFLSLDELVTAFVMRGREPGDISFSFNDPCGRRRSLRVHTQGVFQERDLEAIWCTLRDITEADERERQLEMSRQLLTDTESLVRMGSWSRDFRTGEVNLSPQLPQLFGLAPKGRPYSAEDFLEPIHPADRPDLMSELEEGLLESGTLQADYRVMLPDGSLHHMHATAFLSKDETGVPHRMLGTVQDVTESRLEEERRRAHYDNHPDPMFLVELEAPMPVSLPADKQHRFLQSRSLVADCNQAMLNMLGSERHEIVGRQPEFLSQLWELNAASFCEQGFSLKNRVVKLRHPKRGGETSWIQFDASGTVEGASLMRIWGCLRDVTELVQARNQLQSTVNERTRKLYAEIERRKRNEQLLRQQALISVHMSEAVIIRDLDGRIIDWNEGASRVFGYTAEQALAGAPDFLRPSGGDERPANLPAWFRAHGSWQGELVFVHCDGREVICETSITPLLDESEHISSIIEVNRDITERKAYDLRLAQAMQEAERANQAKSQFLWAMSHELRTPLNAILGFTQMLERVDSEHSSELQKSYMAHIKSGGEHLLRLVNDVLDLAKIEAGEFDLNIAPVDPREVCLEALELVMPQVSERGIRVETDFKGQALILADYTRTKQVLVNLLANGVKYNSPQGQLTVSITDGVGKVRIAVRDTGQGIADDQLEDLFEPFNRLGITDAQVVGSGLGLPISSRLVSAMDAHLGVDSVLGEGSTFWLEFAMVGPEYQMALDW